jgi:hypothetical protein
MHTNKLIANILKTYARRNLADNNDGLTWYTDAQAMAGEVAKETGLELGKVAEVIAALSPNCGWSQNLADTWKVCRAFAAYREKHHIAVCDGRVCECLLLTIEQTKVTTYTRNKNRAFGILAGTDKLQGRKVVPFAENIKGNTELVTIDTHAFSIAQGIRYTVKTCPHISPSEFRQIQKAYTLAAKRVQISPAQLQAITWRTWRRLHGLTRATEYNAKLF